jgi:hypothetical protein
MNTLKVYLADCAAPSRTIGSESASVFQPKAPETMDSLTHQQNLDQL